MAKPSISKIEVAEIALGQILRADLTDADRATLNAALATLTGLRPTVNAADHKPVYTVAQNGDKHVIGCSCGMAPKARPARMSMAMSPFNAHLAKVGVSRDFSPTGNQDPRYTDGARAGMTWNEARAAGLLTV